MTSRHRCACCETLVHTRLLMCSRHWRLVPTDLQQRVNKTWFALNWGSFRNTATARDAYTAARKAAIEAVNPAPAPAAPRNGVSA